MDYQGEMQLMLNLQQSLLLHHLWGHQAQELATLQNKFQANKCHLRTLVSWSFVLPAVSVSGRSRAAVIDEFAFVPAADEYRETHGLIVSIINFSPRASRVRARRAAARNRPSLPCLATDPRE